MINIFKIIYEKYLIIFIKNLVKKYINSLNCINSLIIFIINNFINLNAF